MTEHEEPHQQVVWKIEKVSRMEPMAAWERGWYKKRTYLVVHYRNLKTGKTWKDEIEMEKWK